jgi:hypothetical protein
VTAARLTTTVESSGRSTPRAWGYLRRKPSFRIEERSTALGWIDPRVLAILRERARRNT